MLLPEITAGVTAVKASVEVGKSIRDLINRPDVDRGEVEKCLQEMLIHLGNVHFALNEVAAKTLELQHQLDDRATLKSIQDDLDIDPVARYWLRKSEKERGLAPYCPTCWGSDSKLVPLAIVQHPGLFRCPVHNTMYYSPEHNEHMKNQRATPVRRPAPTPGSWMG